MHHRVVARPTPIPVKAAWGRLGPGALRSPEAALRGLWAICAPCPPSGKLLCTDLHRVSARGRSSTFSCSIRATVQVHLIVT